MTKNIKARTTINEGWKAPKKRKPMTPEQRVAAAERLEKARAAKAPAKNETIHSSVLSRSDDEKQYWCHSKIYCFLVRILLGARHF